MKASTSAMVVSVGLLALVAWTSSAMAETVKTSAGASSVQAVGSKVTGDHTLTFSDFEGAAELDGNTPKSIGFTIQMNDFSSELDGTWNDKLVGHLKSPDFFDVATYKTATFQSVSITPKKTKYGTHMVKGRLTLRGKAMMVTFPATIRVDAKSATGKAEFTINRKDFGIVYKGKPDDLIKNNVLLKVNLNFKR